MTLINMVIEQFLLVDNNEDDRTLVKLVLKTSLICKAIALIRRIE